MMGNKTLSPYELGKKAFHSKIIAPCKDKDLMDFIKKHTTGEIGSGTEFFNLWIKGRDFEMHRATNAELKKEFPELYK